MRVVAVLPGPVITRFEIEPAAGVKVSRISALSKDLARALSVPSVRIVEIIPGKSVIGLEIPNVNREIVSRSSYAQTRCYPVERSWALERFRKFRRIVGADGLQRHKLFNAWGLGSISMPR